MATNKDSSNLINNLKNNNNGSTKTSNSKLLWTIELKKLMNGRLETVDCRMKLEGANK